MRWSTSTDPRARAPSLVLRFCGAGLAREGQAVLQGVDWEVREGERWVVMGPNGSGKTTLLRLAGAELQPSTGTVEVLGHRLGRVDLRLLRADIGLVSGTLTRALRPSLTAEQVVLTGRFAALEPWWHSYSEADRERADKLLAELGVAHLGNSELGVISEGERQQVILARALMGSPRLLLLDEPAAGLDMGARERLMGRLRRLAEDPATPVLVLVTHHPEEIPAGTTHVALLAAGKLVGQGPIREALTADALSECFGARVSLAQEGGRWSARAWSD